MFRNRRRRGGSVPAIRSFQDAEDRFKGFEGFEFRAGKLAGAWETIFALRVVACGAFVKVGVVHEKTLAAPPHIHDCLVVGLGKGVGGSV